MKIKIRNTKNKKSYDVEVNDTDKKTYLRRPLIKKDEKICENCNQPVSSCVCEKETNDEKKEPEKFELNKEQFEQIEKLLKLLPDLEKLLDKAPEEKEKKKEKAEKEEPEKEESEKESEKEESSKKEADSQFEEFQPEEQSEIILEGSEDNNFENSEEFEFEEDVIEDENDSVCDSILNPGVIEKTKVSDSINDTITHEQEVANAWDERYKEMLNHK